MKQRHAGIVAAETVAAGVITEAEEGGVAEAGVACLAAW